MVDVGWFRGRSEVDPGLIQGRPGPGPGRESIRRPSASEGDLVLTHICALARARARAAGASCPGAEPEGDVWPQRCCADAIAAAAVAAAVAAALAAATAAAAPEPMAGPDGDRWRCCAEKPAGARSGSISL